MTESSRKNRKVVMPADVWIPSAIRIFRENKCSFEYGERPLCKNGSRSAVIDIKKVDRFIISDDYKGLRKYLVGLCVKARKGKNDGRKN